MRKILISALLIASGVPALAQNKTGMVVNTCGSLPTPFANGKAAQITIKANGRLCLGTASGSDAFAVTGGYNTTGLAQTSCGGQSLSAGKAAPITLDLNGNICK